MSGAESETAWILFLLCTHQNFEELSCGGYFNRSLMGWVFFRQLFIHLVYEVNCTRLKETIILVILCSCQNFERILLMVGCVSCDVYWHNITHSSLAESISLLLQEFLFLFCCSWEREGSLRQDCLWRERWAWAWLTVLYWGLSRRIPLVSAGDTWEMQLKSLIKTVFL